MLFLSGVRRGLSFRSPAGPTWPQQITFFWLFGLGFAALCLQPRWAATGLVAIGFASLALFDWLAARKEEAPPYFARLRPPQMTIAALSTLVLLARQAA